MKLGDFTKLAKHYHNRPAYSALIIEMLLRCVNDKGLPRESLRIAEVGAGTGKFTKILAGDFGLKVTAVEPNDAMRAEGIKYTQGLPVEWRVGSGENTGLETSAYDWLIMAASFHWTDYKKSLPEFARVLDNSETPYESVGNERERERENSAFSFRGANWENYARKLKNYAQRFYKFTESRFYKFKQTFKQLTESRFYKFKKSAQSQRFKQITESRFQTFQRFYKLTESRFYKFAQLTESKFHQNHLAAFATFAESNSQKRIFHRHLQFASYSGRHDIP